MQMRLDSGESIMSTEYLSFQSSLPSCTHTTRSGSAAGPVPHAEPIQASLVVLSSTLVSCSLARQQSIVSGYYTTLLNSVGAAEFSPLPKPHNSTATSPIYLSQPSPFSLSMGDCYGDCYGPRMKKIGWSLLHLRTSDWWQLVCDRC